jgi:hypothetical protein
MYAVAMVLGLSCSPTHHSDDSEGVCKLRIRCVQVLKWIDAA